MTEKTMSLLKWCIKNDLKPVVHAYKDKEVITIEVMRPSTYEGRSNRFQESV